MRRTRLVLTLSLLSSLGCASHAPDPKAACVATPLDASDPFVAARNPSSAEVAQAKAIADRYMAVHPPETLDFNWGEGVLVGALMDLHRVTGEQAYADYARAWLEAKVASGYEITRSDSCPPAISAYALEHETCDAAAQQVVDDTVSYVFDIVPRTAEGAIPHLGTLVALGESVWCDTLYMVGEPLIRIGEGRSDARMLDEYHHQYVVSASHLQDPIGFFVHAYDWSGPQDPNVYFARGNAWVLTSGADYLRVRYARGESDAEVETSLRALSAAIVASQDSATGLWWTVPNRPGETYLETSASALYAYGLARGLRIGVFGPEVRPVIAKAMAGVATRIVDDGQGRPLVTQISGPTDVGTFADYASVPLLDDVTYGVGGVILALIETSGLP